MSTNAIETATASAAKSERRPPKAKGGRNSEKSTKLAKGARQSKAEAKPKPRRANKKAEVIDLMRRPGGATLAEIMDATGWQKHTVRGFVSILGSKGGLKVESTKNATGERPYRVVK